MRPYRIFAAAFGVMIAIAGRGAAEPVEGSSVALEGDHLVATLTDGTIVSGDRLVGLEVPLGGEADGWTIRIDGVAPDDFARRPGTLLYDISVRETPEDAWQKFCEADPYGQTTALAVPGRFDPGPDSEFIPGAPGTFTLACTAGARGKCIRYGYPPWLKMPNGTDLAPYHAACVRMMRADYCGDGTPHTVPGLQVQMIDTAGVNTGRGVLYGEFEAVWGTEGALCIAKARHPRFPLQDVLAACPRLQANTGDSCTPAALETLPGALLANRS